MSTATPALRPWQTVEWRAHIRERSVLGRQLRYVDLGDGPALVLIHGLGGSWQTWLENLPALAARHRVIAVDLPGFGCSEVLPHPAAMSTHALTLIALMDALDIAAATLVGHSMGGLVALEVFAQQPGRVRALVMANAGGAALSSRRLRAIVASLKLFIMIYRHPAVSRAVTRRARLRRMVFAGFMSDPRAMSGAMAAQVVPAIAAPGFVGAVVAASEVVGRADLDAVTCPVLILWGERDRILPLAAARQLEKRLPSGRLHVMRRVGHCPMFEAPAEFNRAIVEFTAELD